MGGRQTGIFPMWRRTDIVFGGDMALRTRPVHLVVTAALIAAGCQLVPGTEAGDADAVRPSPRNETVTVGYTDVAGSEREVRVEIRRPAEPDGRTVPVVVWSHGGSAGRSNPSVVAERWGAAFNSVGFAFVAIAHVGRDDDERRAVCDAVSAGDCETFNTLLWDRPHDVRAVLDRLERGADDLGLDASRIVYGGHSAGAIGVMTTAGMVWPFDSELAPPADTRPVAFIAASPPGTNARGLGERHLAALDRPVLFLTGLGDTTSGTDAADRRHTFDLLPGEPTSFMLWVDDERARHSVFGLETDACRRAGGTRSACRTLVRTVGRIGLEFAAAVVDEAGYDPTEFDRHVAAHLEGGFEWSTTNGDG